MLYEWIAAAIPSFVIPLALLELADLRHVCVHVARRLLVGRVLDADDGGPAGQVPEGERLVGVVHSQGLTELAELDVLTLGHIQLALRREVEEHRLPDGRTIQARRLLDTGVVDLIGDIDDRDLLRRILAARHLTSVHRLDDGRVLALRNGNVLGIVGAGEGIVEERVGIKHWLLPELEYQ